MVIYGKVSWNKIQKTPEVEDNCIYSRDYLLKK